MDLARHIVETKSGHFEPEKFEDHYEHALKDLIEKKAKGEKIEVPKERADRQGHQSDGCLAPLGAGREGKRNPAAAGARAPRRAARTRRRRKCCCRSPAKRPRPAETGKTIGRVPEHRKAPA